MGGNDDAYALGLALIIGLEGGEDWPGLAVHARQLVRDGVEAGDHQTAGLGAFALAALEMAAGRYRDARRWLAEAEGHFDVQDAFGTMFSLRALEVGLAFFTGDLPARGRRSPRFEPWSVKAGPRPRRPAISHGPRAGVRGR